MDDQQCVFPRCKNYTYLLYVRRHICQTHWEQLCCADGKTEKKMLKKIGLVRNKDDAVVPITSTKRENDDKQY